MKRFLVRITAIIRADDLVKHYTFSSEKYRTIDEVVLAAKFLLAQQHPNCEMIVRSVEQENWQEEL